MVDRLVHGGTDWFCGMPFGNAVAVDPAGNAHPCYGLCGDGHCLGDARDRGAAYAKSHVLNALLHETHVSNIADCADCMWRHVCAGGCPALALQCSHDRQPVDSTPSAGAAATDFDYRTWWCQMCQELLPKLTWHVARKLFAQQTGGEPRQDQQD